jgi:hypothetical protein
MSAIADILAAIDMGEVARILGVPNPYYPLNEEQQATLYLAMALLSEPTQRNDRTLAALAIANTPERASVQTLARIQARAAQLAVLISMGPVQRRIN